MAAADFVSHNIDFDYEQMDVLDCLQMVAGFLKKKIMNFIYITIFEEFLTKKFFFIIFLKHIEKINKIYR